jgi:hypothetical protein
MQRLQQVLRWAHLASNQGPTGYEPVALPAELWARPVICTGTLLKTPRPVKRLLVCLPSQGILEILNKTPQYLTATGMTQLAQGFGLDLSDTLTGHIKIVSHFF